MFKRTAVILGRCIRRDCLRSNFLVRSHHLAIIPEPFTANKGQSSQRAGHLNQAPKKLEDGSIHVDYANPMDRRFLHDLDLQQAQRSGRNRWLKEDKKGNQDDLGRLTKQITMAADDGDKKGECQEKDPCKEDDPSKKKKKIEGMSDKCKALAEKDKCRRLAQQKEMQKILAQCREMAQREKCKEMAEIEKCKKKQKQKQKEKDEKDKKDEEEED